MVVSSSSTCDRPTRFEQLIGLRDVLMRLKSAVVSDRIPNLIFLFGPTGSGKTTLARLLARRKLCSGAPRGTLEPCEECPSCRAELDDFRCGLEFYEEVDANALTADRLNDWRFDLLKPQYVKFIDELQELDQSLEKRLKKLVEGSVGTLIFTTTHVDQIQDALNNRLKTFAYELKRPTAQEIVEDYLRPECERLAITVRIDQLLRVANALHCEMRPCAKFPQQVLAEVSDGLVTDEYLDLLYGHNDVTHGDPELQEELI